MPIFGQIGDLAIVNRDQRMGQKPGGDCLGKGISVHGQSAACGQAVGMGHFHNQPLGRAHFPMQEAHCVALIIV